MDKRRDKKHQAHKRSLVVAHDHRGFLERNAGGRNTVGKLERAVNRQAAQFTVQETCRMEGRAAVVWCRKMRRTLQAGIRLVMTVSSIVDGAPVFTWSRVTNDDQLISCVEAVLEAVAPHAADLEREGLQPGQLQSIANQLASFRAAKSAVTLAAAQFTEAAAEFDRAHEEAKLAVAILEGLLATSDDAPAGAQTSLRTAKRIGPRVNEEEVAQPDDAALVAFPASPLPLTGTDGG
jgi:hypothetical protein